MGNWNKYFTNGMVLAIALVFYIAFPYILIGFLLCGIAGFLIFSNPHND